MTPADSAGRKVRFVATRGERSDPTGDGLQRKKSRATKNVGGTESEKCAFAKKRETLVLAQGKRGEKKMALEKKKKKGCFVE